mgnify:CR=1 FL=1
MAIERDRATILSGVRRGETIGSPITLQIPNKDWPNWLYTMSVEANPDEALPGARRAPVTRPRPGHADLSGGLKYDRDDLRDILERASARETAARVAAGGVARALLARFDIEITSHVFLIGGAGLADPLSVTFEAGVPVALNGERLGVVELLERAGEIGARHGIGIVDHLEDRIVGLKVRDIYEVPAAAIVLPAHQELEKLVGTIHQNQFKPGLDRQWAYLVYAGLWWEPLRADLDAFIDHVNAQVSGTITLKLFKGAARVVRRESRNAVYDQALASFGESGGLFSQQASPGFIELWSLQSRMAWRLRHRDGDGA